MAKKKIQDNEVTQSLSNVEEILEEKNESLINDESASEMEAYENQKPMEEIEEAFSETEIDPDSVDDGLEHLTGAEMKEEVVEPIKELIDEAKELSAEKDSVLANVDLTTPEKAQEELTKQIDKIETFKKKLQNKFKTKTNYQIIHSWNGINYGY